MAHVQGVVGDLDITNEDRLLPRLSVLAELALSAPGAFERHSEKIVTFLKNEVLSSSASIVS